MAFSRVRRKPFPVPAKYTMSDREALERRMLKKAEEEAFENFLQDFQKQFKETAFYAKVGPVLETWPGRRVTGAFVVLEEVVETQFPEEKATLQLWREEVMARRAEILKKVERQIEIETFLRKIR